MRVAVIDCGTNSIRLLVASQRDGRLVDEVRELRMVRLGQGVDATGEFHPEALARTFEACDEYATLIEAQPVDRLRFVATSAARDAGNRAEFFAGVEQRLGVTPEIISGTEEAGLSFAGALAGVSVSDQPVVVMDIGGGSTELVRGADGRVTTAVSLDIGSVRLRERVLQHEVPTPDEVQRATELIDELLDASPVELSQIGTWIGVAGTVTSLAAADLGLVTYDPSRVHGHVISPQRIIELTDGWLTSTVDQIIAATPAIPRKRAEVICAGGLIARQVARRIQRPLVVSESDILDGLALALAND